MPVIDCDNMSAHQSLSNIQRVSKLIFKAGKKSQTVNKKESEINVSWRFEDFLFPLSIIMSKQPLIVFFFFWKSRLFSYLSLLEEKGHYRKKKTKNSNHRITKTETDRLGKTGRDTERVIWFNFSAQVGSSYSTQHRTAFRWFLSISCEGNSTISLSNLLLCLVTKFFLRFKWNFLFISFCL